MARGGDGNKLYTMEDVEQDMKTMAKLIKTIASNNKTVMERMEQVENTVNNVATPEEDEDFGPADRKKALSVLADRVINPDDSMLPQMTETPDRLIVSLAVEHARNEFIKERLKNPDSLVLFSDLLMKWFSIIMRSRHRALIGEAMGFSQIEVDKAMDEATRGLEAQGER